MSADKQKQLVMALKSKTEKATLAWERSLADNAFQVSIKNNTVRISEQESAFDESSDYFVTLIDSEGVAVDSFSDIELDKTETQVSIPKKWYANLRDLYNNARRSALGSDKVLSALLSDLNEKN